MTRILTGIVLTAAAGFAFIQASPAQNQNLGAADKKFMQEANIINIAEIDLGKMAKQQGTSQAVKQFAEHLATDHAKMNQELLMLARKKDVTLTQTLDKKHKELASKLSSMRGADFDQAFAKEMVTGHQKAIDKFESEIKDGQDPQVKAFAEKWVKTLREHLEMARDVEKKVK